MNYESPGKIFLDPKGCPLFYFVSLAPLSPRLTLSISCKTLKAYNY